VALYGVDRLIEDKEFQKATTPSVMLADVIRDREELSEQITKWSTNSWICSSVNTPLRRSRSA